MLPPEWEASYSRWNAHNLDTELVFHPPDKPFVYVHKSHPAVALLKANSSFLGQLPEPIDGELFKMSSQVLNACNVTLRAKVLKAPETQSFGD
jgi:hypothetical protein